MAYRIMLAMPHVGMVHSIAMRSVAHASQKHETFLNDKASSALASNHNQILCDALNAGDRYTHLAIIHSDIGATECWVDCIIDEMDRLDADLISVPNAIKDDRGVLSCGIGKPGVSWYPWRRLTVREILSLPKTFNAADIGYPDYALLHNTGCFVLDLRKPLFHQVNKHGLLQAWFAVRDVVVHIDGKFYAKFEPEDWFFSRRLHELGAKTWITRKVKTNHIGYCEFTNAEPWGRYANGDDDTAGNWREPDCLNQDETPIEDESGNAIGAAT